MSSIGIILAGGIGSRFGADKPKQYCTIFDKEMIWYSIDAFRKAKTIDDFIVVVDANEMKSGRLNKDYGVTLVQGGSTRNESFKNALDYIHEHFPDCENIIENNAACPMITPELIDEFITLLKESSVAFYIGVADLTQGGLKIRSITYSNFMPLIAVALIYLAIVLILTRLVGILERRLRKSDH